MSAYSDYKAGALTEDEYRSISRRENADDEYNGCWNCTSRNQEGWCEPGTFCPFKEGLV